MLELRCDSVSEGLVTFERLYVHVHLFFIFEVSRLSLEYIHLGRLVEKPTMWFPQRSDTNRPLQLQKQAGSLKF